MLILITGLPGSSKTLNTIKYVSEDDLFNKKSDDGKNIVVDGNPVKRPIYYHKINQLTLPWIKLDDEQAKKPHEIEKGAVIIYDECQDIFPVLPNSKAGNTPEHYSYMNKHRHNGHDVILVTQHPKNLNTQLRRLVNKHIHLKRIWGSNFVSKSIFQKCYDEPEEYHSQQNAVISKIEIDKKYFNVYKSAEVHTVKKSLPIGKLIQFGLLILLVVAALGGFAYFMYQMANSYMADDEIEEVQTESQNPLSPESFNYKPRNNQVADPEEYLLRLKPRIEDLPHTAPIYDDLTEPQSFPRIAACIERPKTGDCQCYTQQATRIKTAKATCLDIVSNGYFDPTLPDDRQVRAPYHRSVSYRRSVNTGHTALISDSNTYDFQ